LVSSFSKPCSSTHRNDVTQPRKISDSYGFFWLMDCYIWNSICFIVCGEILLWPNCIVFLKVPTYFPHVFAWQHMANGYAEKW